MDIERRRAGHVRFPVRVPATLETTGGSTGRLRGETQNLSQGGLLLWLPDDHAPGTPVTIILALRRRVPLAVDGTMVRVAPHPTFPWKAVGIRFNRELDLDTVADIADEEFPLWGCAQAEPCEADASVSGSLPGR